MLRIDEEVLIEIDTETQMGFIQNETAQNEAGQDEIVQYENQQSAKLQIDGSDLEISLEEDEFVNFNKNNDQPETLANDGLLTLDADAEIASESLDEVDLENTDIIDFGLRGSQEETVRKRVHRKRQIGSFHI